MNRKSGTKLPQEVFLSHASGNRRMASRIADYLRRHGVPVWYSKTHLKGGQQWHDEIGKALSRCNSFLLLLSPAAVRSTWVKRELLRALSDSRYEDQIIPLDYRQCDFEKLSWTLSSFQFVDFTGAMKAGAQKLLAQWGIEVRVPTRQRREKMRRNKRVK